MPEITYNNFVDGVNDTDRPEHVGYRQLSDGENITLDDRGAVGERYGTTQWADTLTGGSAGIMGFFVYGRYSLNAMYPLCVYNDDIYYHSGSGTWTAQSQSLTADKKADFVNAFDLVYFTNGTDNVRSYNGSAWTEYATVPKGTMIEFHENRLLIAGVSGSEDTLYFSDLGNDTFTSTSYIKVEKAITAIKSGDLYFYIFTRDQMYRFARFQVIEGIATGPDKLELMPAQLGALSDRALQAVGTCLYTITPSGVWRTNGYDKILVTADCKGTWDGLDLTKLDEAAACVFDDKYYLAVRTPGAASNDKILVFDTTKYHETSTMELVPAFVPYTGMTPSCFCLVPSLTGAAPTGENRLFYGDATAGKTFQMETSTNDDDSAITSYATKPVLNDIEPNYQKRLQKVSVVNSNLGAYNMALGWGTSDIPATFHSTNIDQTATGSQTVKQSFLKPNSVTEANPRARYFFLKCAGSGTKDQPWRVDEVAVRYRVRRRFQPPK